MIIQRLSEKKAFCVSERKMTVISIERLRERFEHMKGITDPGRGVTRLAFTDSDWRGSSGGASSGGSCRMSDCWRSRSSWCSA